MFTSAASATSYVQAQSENARQAIALDYAGHYALETLLSRILGGICLTVFLVLVSLRMVRVRRFPLWFGVVGVLCAALQATTALFFAFGPTQATTPTAGLAFIALALWLLGSRHLSCSHARPADNSSSGIYIARPVHPQHPLHSHDSQNSCHSSMPEIS